MNQIKTLGLICKLIWLSLCPNKDGLTVKIAETLEGIYNYSPETTVALTQGFLEDMEEIGSVEAVQSYYKDFLKTNTNKEDIEYGRAILNLIEMSNGRKPRY